MEVFMKKAILFVFSLLFAIPLFTSCTSDPDYSDSSPAPKAEENQTQESLYLAKYIEDDKNARYETVYYYDESYRVVKEIKYITPKKTENPSSVTVTEITYGENGYENYRKVIRSYEQDFISETYTVSDERGRTVTKRTVDTYNGKVSSDITESFVYTDAYGSFISTTDKFEITQAYDEKGNIVSITTKSGASGFTSAITYENTYDGDLLVEVKENNPLLGQIMISRHTYDAGGNLTKTDIYYLTDDAEVYYGTQEFKYDTYGNKTKQVYTYQYENQEPETVIEEWIYSKDVSFAE